ncbi:MAG TPA: TlpA disulfide reductase family protein [Bryobacteraceae bacterium]|nr:TlpA disulfide reductase family protein [Bryobacteraceae bacterium]
MNTALPRFTLVALLVVSAFATQSTVRARLQPLPERTPAPGFALKDASGRTLDLKSYRGKVVLLDFWATWCGGCREEIPWFATFQRTYGARGFAVVGVSMDDSGWAVLKPFLASTRVPYRMLLGNDGTAQRYGISVLPDTFLIDKHGRIAAAYKGLVDKDDVETNIRAMLSER